MKFNYFRVAEEISEKKARDQKQSGQWPVSGQLRAEILCPFFVFFAGVRNQYCSVDQKFRSS